MYNQQTCISLHSTAHRHLSLSGCQLAPLSVPRGPGQQTVQQTQLGGVEMDWIVIPMDFYPNGS